MTGSSKTPAEQCRRLVEILADKTGIAWTFGYIGNCGAGYDDRAWYAFAPHPGRVGTAADRIGGYSTDELESFRTFLRGTIAITNFTEAS